MTIEYLYLAIASVLFSAQFTFTKQYQRMVGTTDASASFFHKAIAPTAFVIVLLSLNGFRLSVTPFSLLLAFLNVFILLSSSLCSIKVLAKGSLANYSLYLMSGGMILPVVYGFFLGGDAVNIWKIVSIAVILAAIFGFFFKEKPTPRGWVSITLAVVGTIFMMF